MSKYNKCADMKQTKFIVGSCASEFGYCIAEISVR